MSAPYYQDEHVTLFAGDCLDVLPTLPDASVDAVCTDPPYGLEFMGKEWDKFDRPTNAWTAAKVSKPAGRVGSDGVNRSKTAPVSAHTPAPSFTAGRPFQSWCELWAAECLRVLKPGGHLLAFGGTRTSHRLACAIEDAGFEIRDSIAWLYGSGFPKSLDVGKAIDKRPGVRRHAEFAAHLAERREAARLSRADVSERVVGTRSGACWNWEHHQFPEAKWWPALRDLLDMDDETWGSVIAEAERAVMAERRAKDRRNDGTVVGLGHTGNADITAPATDDARTWQGWGTAMKPAHEPIVVARKPLSGNVAANVLAHGTGALNVDGCRVAGEVPSVPQPVFGVKADGVTDFGAGGGCNGTMSAAAGRWPANVVLDESQARVLDQQSGTLTSGANPTRRGSDKFRDAYGEFAGQTECTPARGVDVGGASRFFYVAKADSAERPRVNGTAHPTVKPLALMRWLVRLVTPPGGTVLDLFAGSGSTVEAARLEGFRCIAIERETDYLPLITSRLNQGVLDFEGTA